MSIIIVKQHTVKSNKKNDDYDDLVIYLDESVIWWFGDVMIWWYSVIQCNDDLVILFAESVIW